VSKFCFDALLIRHQLHVHCTAALIYHDRPRSSISGAIQWHQQVGEGGGAAAALDATATAAEDVTFIFIHAHLNITSECKYHHLQVPVQVVVLVV
jgi:hypothetical protein